MCHYRLSVSATFSAAHNLINYKGKCERLHGHNWKAKVTVGRDDLNDQGMVIDFGDIKRMLDEVISKLDHRYLNELPYFEEGNVTSERIAEYLAVNMEKRLPDGVRLCEVTVWESENSSVTYRP